MSGRSTLLVGATLAGVLGATVTAKAQALKDLQAPDTPLVLKAQGSFYVGGEKSEQTELQLGQPVRFVGSTAILLNKIRLVAVVGGNEVVNPFNVTEVYVKVDEAWKLASLSFTRLLTP